MDESQGPYYYNSQTGMPNRDFRPRRPHTKSKKGCNQCKNRRIKCDELKPRCSRCSKGDLHCRYPDNISSGEPSPSGLPLSLQVAPQSVGSSSSSSPGYHPGSCFPSYPPGHPGLSRESCPAVPPPPGPASEHSELWNHFITHTSQTLTFEAEDLYTLQVGIPGLVKDCPALAATVLSVAATCSCVDIVSHAAPMIPADRARVMELLSQANRHHLHSLQTMQRVIAAGGPAPHEDYDHILANAWLMAAYGTASHRLRIWLYTTQPGGQPPLEEQFLPNQSGWITMFQTVHDVYTGLLQHSNQGLEAGAESCHGTSGFGDFWSGEGVPVESASTLTPAAPDDYPVPFSEEIILPTGQPMHLSHHDLFPILVSSSDEALQALRQHANRVSLLVSDSPLDLSATISHQEALISSQLAVDILSDIVNQITNNSSSSCAQNINQEHTNRGGLQFDFPSIPEGGQFRPVSPWLRRYLSRALAVTPSRSLRRLLMAFLYGVPRPFLDTVKRLLDSLPLTLSSSSLVYASPIDIVADSVPLGQLDFSAAEDNVNIATSTIQEMLDTLAMDVFAHWLAFTLLLDGVWFFGEVGSWELGRIVGMVRSGRLEMDVENRGGHGVSEGLTRSQWWPGRIYEFAERLKVGEMMTAL